MGNRLIRLFERYWINITFGALWFALVFGILIALWLGSDFEELRKPIAVAIGLFPFVVKGNEWAQWICQHIVKPSIKVAVDYKYIIDENRRLVTAIVEFNGDSKFKIHVPNIFFDLNYESPKEKRFTFPLSQKTIDIDKTIPKGKKEILPIQLTIVDPYFFNDVLESRNNNKRLRLLFWLKSSPEVMIFWRLKVPIKYEVHIVYDEIPTIRESE